MYGLAVAALPGLMLHTNVISIGNTNVCDRSILTNGGVRVLPVKQQPEWNQDTASQTA